MAKASSMVSAEAKNIAPLFAFGHGLSYTTFDYTNASLSSKSIREGGRV